MVYVMVTKYNPHKDIRCWND